MSGRAWLCRLLLHQRRRVLGDLVQDNPQAQLVADRLSLGQRLGVAALGDFQPARVTALKLLEDGRLELRQVARPAGRRNLERRNEYLLDGINGHFGSPVILVPRSFWFFILVLRSFWFFIFSPTDQFPLDQRPLRRNPRPMRRLCNLANRVRQLPAVVNLQLLLTPVAIGIEHSRTPLF